MPNEGQQVSLKEANALYLEEETARRCQQQTSAKQLRDAMELIVREQTNDGSRDKRPGNRKGTRK